MKKILLSFILIFAISYSASAKIYSEYFYYVDPIPGAKYVNSGTNIILTPQSYMDIKSLLISGSVTITGSASGVHGYSIKYDEDTRTIMLQPYKPFELGESVNITLNSSIRKKNGAAIKPFSYSFLVQTAKTYILPKFIYEKEFNVNDRYKLPDGKGIKYTDNTLPEIKVNYYNGPARGRFFFTNISFFPPFSTSYLIILNNNGQVFHSIKPPAAGFDFKLQPNGHLTYWHGLYEGKFYELDTNYNLIDSIYCGLGDTTDVHELRLLTNRHALLMSYNAQTIDMSQIVQGGHPKAKVIGLIVQEVNENRDVVFRWRSWDHFQITDATHENLTDSVIDYVHGNAIELDNDGNLMISSRNMDEITKINRTTGDIIWRLSGKNNQFNFINDPIQFSHQHCIRRISNGNIILFDNGNFHNPPFSRAVEYRLDETNKIAELVWQYRNTPDIYAFAMGSVQRLDNGNTVIGWGSANPTITEVKYDGSKAIEIDLPTGMVSYRAFKFNWKMHEPDGQLTPIKLELGQNYPNPFNSSTIIKFAIPNVNSDNSAIDVKLTVYDILGREVSVIIDEKLLPDSYITGFTADNLSSGVYFYKLVAGTFTISKRMVLIK